MKFPVSPALIWELVDRIDPVAYGQSRNYIDGAVSKLSPYLSRGVLSTRQVMAYLLNKGYAFANLEPYIRELAWREYFQRVLQVYPSLHQKDIRQAQTGATEVALSTAIIEARTGIEAIDAAIKALYETGYMHNHCRMYVAAVSCHFARTHWLQPSQWMYFHLLDADVASNACSWQWVAGCFSSKIYVANQENINKYCKTSQHGTFLDRSYDQLIQDDIPVVLERRSSDSWQTTLPVYPPPTIDPALPVLVYTPYHLDPEWRKTEKANRILLLDTEHFNQFPVAHRTIAFMVALSKNIKDLQVFAGTYHALQAYCRDSRMVTREHPLFNYPVQETDDRDWMFPEVKGYYPSFFSYWKQCKKYLRGIASSTK